MQASKKRDDCLYIFARFHSKPGFERDVEREIVKVLGPTREEAECLGANMFRSARDDRLFYIHSQWQTEAGFEAHADQPYTKAFVDAVAKLIDHPLDVVRTRLID